MGNNNDKYDVPPANLYMRVSLPQLQKQFNDYVVNLPYKDVNAVCQTWPLMVNFKIIRLVSSAEDGKWIEQQNRRYKIELMAEKLEKNHDLFYYCRNMNMESAYQAQLSQTTLGLTKLQYDFFFPKKK